MHITPPHNTATFWRTQGLTGATAATRLVGGTVSGPPTSGTFAVGDWVTDQTAQTWVCTVAGSPGTWAASGSGRELGYAEITSAITTITASGAANRVDLSPALTVTVVVGVRPIFIEANIPFAANSVADRGGGIAICDSSGTILQQSVGHNAYADALFPLNAKARQAPAAGSHTYKVMAWRLVGGNFTLGSGGTAPAFLRVTEG